MPRSILAAAFAVCLFAVPLVVHAADMSVVLDVHHAGCVLCGPIVKSTLAHVKGVSAVQVSQPNGDADVTATVTYNTTATSPAVLIKAVTDQGYPAEIAKPAKG